MAHLLIFSRKYPFLCQHFMVINFEFFNAGLVNFLSYTRCLWSDIFQTEHELFRCLIERKNRLRCKKKEKLCSELITKWLINVSFPVLLGPSRVRRIRWVQAQDYAKCDRNVRDMGRVYFILIRFKKTKHFNWNVTKRKDIQPSKGVFRRTLSKWSLAKVANMHTNPRSPSPCKPL